MGSYQSAKRERNPAGFCTLLGYRVPFREFFLQVVRVQIKELALYGLRGSSLVKKLRCELKCGWEIWNLFGCLCLVVDKWQRMYSSSSLLKRLPFYQE